MPGNSPVRYTELRYTGCVSAANCTTVVALIPFPQRPDTARTRTRRLTDETLSHVLSIESSEVTSCGIFSNSFGEFDLKVVTATNPGGFCFPSPRRANAQFSEYWECSSIYNWAPSKC